jgi:membrane protein
VHDRGPSSPPLTNPTHLMPSYRPRVGPRATPPEPARSSARVRARIAAAEPASAPPPAALEQVPIAPGSLPPRSAGLVNVIRFWANPSHWPPRLHEVRAVLDFAARRAREMRLPQVAGSLTFTTVLALVPLLAVALSIFASYPMFADLRSALERNFIRELLPEQYAGVLARYLDLFATKATQLTVVGLGFVVVTAIAMIWTVDRTLNELWLVRQQRPLAQRLAVYWALITIGPLLVAGSLAATSYLVSMSNGLVQQLPGVVRAAVDYLPLLVSGFAYAALYVVVPNRRVQWRDALIGGFAAAVVGELIKDGFAAYVRAGTVTTIYGAFAAVPLFLMWVYLSWLTVLLGAAIAATIPMLRTMRFADEARPGNDFLTAVALLRELYASVDSGGDFAVDTLANATRTRTEDVEVLLRTMERLGYARELGGAFAGRWRLIADPSTVTLRPLFEELALDPANTLLARAAGERDRTAANACVSDWWRMDELARLDWPLARLSSAAAQLPLVTDSSAAS